MLRNLLFFTALCFISCKRLDKIIYTPPQTETKAVELIQQNQLITHKVIGVKDGDTVVLLIDGKETTVRLAHIDCPEKRQDFGTKAKQFVSDLCFGKNVVLNQQGTDRYKRIIGEIILENGVNINKELVKNGLAWHYKKYSKDDSYAQLEIYARTNKIGIWSHPTPIAPWNFRKPKKAK